MSISLKNLDIEDILKEEKIDRYINYRANIEGINRSELSKRLIKRFRRDYHIEESIKDRTDYRIELINKEINNYINQRYSKLNLPNLLIALVLSYLIFNLVGPKFIITFSFLLLLIGAFILLLGDIKLETRESKYCRVNLITINLIFYLIEFKLKSRDNTFLIEELRNQIKTIKEKAEKKIIAVRWH